MKEVKALLTALSAEGAGAAELSSVSLPALTPLQIQRCFTRLLEGKFHLIDPALFQQTGSPLRAGSEQGAAVFKTLQAIRMGCQAPSGPINFSKPIVMVIPEYSKVASREAKGQDSKARGALTVVIWKAIVLLPPRYQTPEGQSLNNAQPLFYYFDSQTHQPQQIPQAVAQLGLAMSQGCAIPAFVQGRQVMVRMEPLFPRPQFVNASHIFCREEAEASSWWAVCFALTTVFTGRCEFEARSIPSLARLQQQLRPWTEEALPVRARLSEAVASLLKPAEPVAVIAASISANQDQKADQSSVAQASPAALESKDERVKAGSLSAPAEGVSVQLPSQRSSEKIEEIKAAKQDHLLVEVVPSPASNSSSKPMSEKRVGREEVKPEDLAAAPAKKSPPLVDLGISSRVSDEKDFLKPVEASVASAVVVSAGAPAVLVSSPGERKIPLSADHSAIYSPAMQAGILRAYGLSDQPKTGLSKDASGQFEVYFYPHGDFTERSFLQDTLSYWRAKQGKIENRRIAFLLSHERPLAILIQLSARGNASAQSLWSSHAAKEDVALLADNEFIQQAQQWHENIQVTILGVEHRDPDAIYLLKTLKAALVKAYRLQGSLPLNFKPIADRESADIILVQDILSMLSLARTREHQDKAALQKEHHQTCVQTVLGRLAGFALQNPAIYRSLVEEVQRLTKFSLLIEQRKTYGRELADVVAHDQGVKAFIYAQPLPDLKAMIRNVAIKELLELLALPAVEHWFPLLQQKSQEKRMAVVRWEQELKNPMQSRRANFCDYLTDKAQQAALFVYRFSWIGLSQSIVEGLAKTALEDKTPSAEVQKITGRVADLAEQAIRVTTRSTRLASRSHQTVTAFFSEYPLSRSLGLAGAGLGMWLQWTLGPMDLLRMILIVGGTQSMNRLLQSRQIREEKAELIPAVLSPTGVLRLMQLTMSLGEVMLTRHFYPLIAAAGGIGGNLLATTLAKAVQPSLASRSVADQEQRQSLLFLVALAGGQLGRVVMSMSYQIAVSVHERSTYRQVAFSFLNYLVGAQSADIQQLRAEGPDFWTSPSLWWSEENPIRISWTTRAGLFREVNCQVQSLPVLTPQGMLGIVCEEISPELLSVIPGLPAP